jgi:glycosyltransferase involved in cell wall biosynthesis
MRFSVVVPTYNRVSTLRRTLDALAAQDYSGFEIIVVDDGSTDGTKQMISSTFPQVRYLYQSNRGPASARNTGIRAATGDIVAFTDDDCEPPPEWLSVLADGYCRYPHVAGVGGYLEPRGEVLRCVPLARYEAFIARHVYSVNDRERVSGFDSPAGGTNNMSYWLRVLEQVGGLDESFRFAAGEDADLKWRICALGCQLLYVPVKVVHLQDYDWPRFRRQSFNRGRGRVQFEIQRGHRPGRLIVLARLASALIRVPLDLVQMPERMFALAHFVELAYGFGGQWVELSHK